MKKISKIVRKQYILKNYEEFVGHIISFERDMDNWELINPKRSMKFLSTYSKQFIINNYKYLEEEIETFQWESVTLRNIIESYEGCFRTKQCKIIDYIRRDWKTINSRF